MVVSLDAMLCCCFVCTVMGLTLPLICVKIFRRIVVVPQSDRPPLEQAPPVANRDLNFVVNDLVELTKLVDLQVGQHSLRINEITNSLEKPGEIGSAVILVAGEMLIGANKQLQAELNEAKNEIQRQREMMTSCIQESRIDALTSIPNRRALDETLLNSIADYRRRGADFSVLILDVDHFKRVNDRYGHMVGDQLLKSFSRSLTSTFRETDFVARFGGEEFVAILPNTTLSDACEIAERVRKVISATHHKIGELELRITTSVGLKQFQNEESDCEFLEKADKALYAAKNGGRNCCFYHDGTKSCRYIPDVAEFPFELLQDSLNRANTEADHLLHEYARETETVFQ
jgi:diguanylate cyclase